MFLMYLEGKQNSKKEVLKWYLISMLAGKERKREVVSKECLEQWKKNGSSDLRENEDIL